MPRRTPGSPATALASRVYWTRERVIAGLQRVARDFGSTPTATRDYNELTRYQGPKHSGRGRPYPSFYAVLKFWPTFREAWEAAGIQQNRWWEEWSELEDWFIREAAGILTREQIAVELRRSPDAVHRRLYDLGIHTYQHHGWSPNRIERATGIPQGVVTGYLLRGELAYFRGSKVIYIDPADLVVVDELDWEHLPAELEHDIRQALTQRLASILNGGDWRANRLYQTHRETSGRFKKVRKRWTRPAEPAALQTGQRVRCVTRVEPRPELLNREGLVQAVIWCMQRQSGEKLTREKGWYARVEFPKVRNSDVDTRPRVTVTLPVGALEVIRDVIDLEVLTDAERWELFKRGRLAMHVVRGRIEWEAA